MNDSCKNAVPFCGSGTYLFQAGVNSGNGQTGPCYSCLGSTPNPAWFYMQIGLGGNIIITMSSSPAKDIDFCCWGPFTSPTGPCTGGLTCAKVVSCSYSNSSTETCTIPNALPGEFYMLVITNFSNANCNITFSQTNWGQPGAGTTNCNIVVQCSVVSLLPSASSCNPSTGTYNLTGQIDFSNPPTTGTLTVTDFTASPNVSQTFTAPFTSPQPYTLPNIACDGQQHVLSAIFSDSALCQYTTHYSAPQVPCPVATISGGGQICANSTTPATININLTQGSPPINFTYAINGVPQPPVTNYNGPFPYQINTFSAGTYTLVAVSNSSCSGTYSGSASVVVHPVPVVNLNPLADVCIDTPPFLLSGGTPVGGTYNGRGANSTTSIFDASKAGVGLDTVIYKYTDAWGCKNSDSAIFMVHDKPVITVNPFTPAICSGNQCNITFNSSIAGSTCAWSCFPSSTSISGFANGVGGSIIQNLVNSGFNIEYVKYVIIATASGCQSLPDTVKITVYPVPNVISAPSAPSICSGQTTNIFLTSNVLNVSFDYTATGTPNVTGFSGGNNNKIQQALTSTGTGIDTVTYHITPTANGCAGPVFHLSVIVNPKPHLITNPMSSTICSEQSTNVVLLSSCMNTSFTWTASLLSGSVSGFSNGVGPLISQVLTNLLSTPGQVLYIIKPTAGSCMGTDTNFTVTVNPKPLLTNTPASLQICNGTSTNIPLNSNVSGTLFTWTCTASSGNVSGFYNNATPSGLLDQTLVNSGYATETVIYHITPHANGCDGALTDYIVTVYPTSTLTNTPASKTQCNNLATGITLNSNVSGTLFTWTCTPSSGNIIGFNNNATPTGLLDQTLVNSGNIAEMVTYHITPHANGCDGTPTDYIVTVNPTATLSNTPASQNQCNNLSTGIPLSSPVSGTLFTWTCTPSSGNITGFYNNVTPAGLLDQTLINSGNTPETVTYHITPHANGCDGTMTDYIVMVYPTATLTNTPSNKNQCNNLLTGITLNSNVSGTLFTWTCTPSSGNITGFYNNATPSGLLNQTLINSGYTIETVNYHITPHANGCDGSPADYLVTVYPTPDLANTPASKNQCNNLPTGIVLNSNVTGTLFTWTCTPSSANITGFYNNSTPTGLLDQTLVNSGYATETVIYHLTPHANGCDGVGVDYLVTVYPTPNLSNSPAAKSQCNNQPTGITLNSNVSGTLFTWSCTPSSGNISGFYNNSTPTGLLDQTLVNSGSISETVI
ncbi:MAG: PKD-like domain-containing protein, partial [Bacteroidota bacterium]